MRRCRRRPAIGTVTARREPHARDGPRRQARPAFGGQGEEFDELFLKYMIRHHQGALTMVRDLAADGGGNEPEIGAFTRHVEADQNIEISRMEDLQDARPDAVRFAGPSKATRERAQRLSYAGGRPLICYVG